MAATTILSSLIDQTSFVRGTPYFSIRTSITRVKLYILSNRLQIAYSTSIIRSPQSCFIPGFVSPQQKHKTAVRRFYVCRSDLHCCRGVHPDILPAEGRAEKRRENAHVEDASESDDGADDCYDSSRTGDGGHAPPDESEACHDANRPAPETCHESCECHRRIY